MNAPELSHPLRQSNRPDYGERLRLGMILPNRNIVAEADAREVNAALERLKPLPVYAEVRKPEVGLVMLRGRIGGDGAPFNVGEATVTRAAVRLESGEIGFSYLLGRAIEKARAAALIDAIWQSTEGRARVEADVVAPLAAAQAAIGGA